MKKRVTLYVDVKIYDEYKEFCDSNSMVISKKIEHLIFNDLKKIKEEADKFGKQ